MVRVFVLYDEAPDPARYAEHVELCHKVPGATFTHGSVFGSPTGEPKHRYYAAFDFANMDAFKSGASSPEFAACGKDAMEMGVRFSVEFAELA
jgi:hypothetical protein